jgi:hypothetical protein
MCPDWLNDWYQTQQTPFDVKEVFNGRLDKNAIDLQSRYTFSVSFTAHRSDQGYILKPGNNFDIFLSCVSLILFCFKFLCA